MTSPYYSNDNDEWEKSFQEIFLRTKSNLEQVNQRYGYHSPDPPEGSIKLDVRDSIKSNDTNTSRPRRKTRSSSNSIDRGQNLSNTSISFAPHSGTIEIDINQWNNVLERLNKLESKSLHQSNHGEEMQQLMNKCHHLETQVTIMTNELEKQRMLLSSKDKWTDVMEDLQGTVTKQRGSILKLEHEYQDIEAWRDAIDKQLQKMQKTIITNGKDSQTNESFRQELDQMRERIETMIQQKVSTITNIFHDKIDSNTQMFDRKIASVRSQLIGRISNQSTNGPPSPNTSSSSISNTTTQVTIPLSPNNDSRNPSMDFDQPSSSQKQSTNMLLSPSSVNTDISSLDIIVRGVVAKQLRDIETSLESKLESRVQASAIAKVYDLEKELKGGIELTLRHLATNLGLVITSEPSSPDAQSGKYFDGSNSSERKSNRQSSPLRGSGASPLLLKVKPLAKASWEAEMKAMAVSVQAVSLEMRTYEKLLHELKVDMKVELRELTRGLEDMRNDDSRAYEGLEQLYRKLERYEVDRKTWEDKLEQDVQIMQNELLTQYHELSSRTLDDVVPLEKRLVIVERIAHDALEKFKGNASMLESSFAATSYFKKYEAACQTISQLQQVIPSIQKEILDMNQKYSRKALDNNLNDDLYSNIQTQVHQLEPYVHTMIPQLESNYQAIVNEISTQRQSNVSLESSIRTILTECTGLERNLQEIKTNLSELEQDHNEYHDRVDDLDEEVKDSISKLQVEVAEIQRSVANINMKLQEYTTNTSAMLAKLQSQMDYLRAEVTYSTADVKRSINDLQANYATIDMQNHLIHEQLQQLQGGDEPAPILTPEASFSTNRTFDKRSNSNLLIDTFYASNTNHNNNHSSSGNSNNQDMIANEINNPLSTTSSATPGSVETKSVEDIGFNFDNVYHMIDNPRPPSPSQPVIVNKISPSKPPPRRLGPPMSPLSTHSTTVTPANVLAAMEKDSAISNFTSEVNPMVRRRTNSNTSLSSMGTGSNLSANSPIPSASPLPNASPDPTSSSSPATILQSLTSDEPIQLIPKQPSTRLSESKNTSFIAVGSSGIVKPDASSPPPSPPKSPRATRSWLPTATAAATTTTSISQPEVSMPISTSQALPPQSVSILSPTSAIGLENAPEGVVKPVDTLKEKNIIESNLLAQQEHENPILSNPSSVVSDLSNLSDSKPIVSESSQPSTVVNPIVSTSLIPEPPPAPLSESPSKLGLRKTPSVSSNILPAENTTVSSSTGKESIESSTKESTLDPSRPMSVKERAKLREEAARKPGALTTPTPPPIGKTTNIGLGNAYTKTPGSTPVLTGSKHMTTTQNAEKERRLSMDSIGSNLDSNHLNLDSKPSIVSTPPEPVVSVSATRKSIPTIPTVLPASSITSTSSTMSLTESTSSPVVLSSTATTVPAIGRETPRIGVSRSATEFNLHDPTNQTNTTSTTSAILTKASSSRSFHSVPSMSSTKSDDIYDEVFEYDEPETMATSKKANVENTKSNEKPMNRAIEKPMIEENVYDNDDFITENPSFPVTMSPRPAIISPVSFEKPVDTMTENITEDISVQSSRNSPNKSIPDSSSPPTKPVETTSTIDTTKMIEKARIPAPGSPPDPSTLSVKERMKLRQDAITRNKSTPPVPTNVPIALQKPSPSLKSSSAIAGASNSTNLTLVSSTGSSTPSSPMSSPKSLPFQRGSVSALANKFSSNSSSTNNSNLKSNTSTPTPSLVKTPSQSSTTSGLSGNTTPSVKEPIKGLRKVGGPFSLGGSPSSTSNDMTHDSPSLTQTPVSSIASMTPLRPSDVVTTDGDENNRMDMVIGYDDSYDDDFSG